MLPVGSAPLWWLAPPPLPLWEACHWILSRPRAPYEPSSLATPLLGRATKGKRLYGQARRLTSPDLHILCRMCTVGLWVLGSGINLNLWQQRRENHTTGLAPVEMHPFCRLSATSLHRKACHWIFGSLRFLTNPVPLPPRRGRFALCSTSGRISISRHNAAKTSPLRGKNRRRRG